MEWHRLQPVKDQPSIAVLPFANLSADKDNEYFSDGLAEEIISALTQVQGLKVAARTSAFWFRGKDVKVAGIARELGVEHVLEGSVRKAGNRIRVTAQLVKAADGFQLWSERYDRERRDVFDIQDEIAQPIVEKLKVKLAGKAAQPLVKRYTENLEAHNLYLKGNFYFYRQTGNEMEQGRECLEQAVALEPGHAPAWFTLADYHVGSAHYGITSPPEQWAQARSAAVRALEADPSLAEAHAALGLVTALGEYQWAEGLRQLDAAVRMNPVSGRACFWRADVLHCLGRTGEAISDSARAVELDPLSALFSFFRAYYHLCLGQPEDAVRYARSALEVDPNFPLASVAAALGDVEKSFRLAQEAGRDRDPNLAFAIRSPYFQPLQADPRYQDLLRQMNLQTPPESR